ncbi:DegT/DnrJ/EryC1/StrS family aminotransferase [Luteibaculum oceani]|uniref:DegT/DnrJ/EryC1/StrS family aminotransferase n=1 Tax=Luteibaculum oceani TaxID=1294296 RepID=A0A5C6V8P5_9FLAO|nr:DegT/DnrJ/EryC1/StrS family aminotransferase [Luteibaculum oceani]TXC81407.1 DegT/DnrJ/EryC1/StrS family aminotransferase [Luteibaculum oceani]
MIPVNTPVFNGNEEKYLVDCIRSGWISSEGSYVTRFEREFASYIGMDHGVAVSNGSAALDIALEAIGLNEGDEVIMPTFTIISPAFSVLRTGAKIVLVDMDNDTWNMALDEVESKITPKTKAIIAVHIYGLTSNLKRLREICDKKGIILIEDAAEAHGQEVFGKKVGSYGDISTFSFYPNKTITTGEGGIVLTRDVKLAEKARELRNLSFKPSKRRFVHYSFGWNYRMTNLQAAIGCAQLENIEEHIRKKKLIGKLYTEQLKGIPGVQLPLEKTNFSVNNYWVFGIVLDDEEKAIYVQEELGKHGIGTRPFFWSMHEQPVFNELGLFLGEHYPIAERLSRCGFYLPSGLGLNETEIQSVCQAFRNLINQ